mmetsp:Transcript_3957/g.8733  ORF Transcript_3957/g.8733 Transcript_3957/m.8733 type:complete len:86 (-) Transcript_3957:740-997(-)
MKWLIFYCCINVLIAQPFHKSKVYHLVRRIEGIKCLCFLNGPPVPKMKRCTDPTNLSPYRAFTPTTLSLSLSLKNQPSSSLPSSN